MILPELDEPVRLEPPVGLPSNLWIRNKPLHSRINSEREFERFLRTFQSYSDGTRVLLIGAGALFDRLRTVADRLQLTIYEPIIPLRNLYRERTDFTIAESPPRPESFDSTVVLPAYRRMFPELSGLGSDNVQISQVDQQTTKHFLRSWMRNYSLRIYSPAVHFWNGIAPLPSTVLFCGAAPTLLADLERLKTEFTRNGEEPFIIVADTAAAAVVHAGWPVDLVVSVDSGFGTAYHLSLLKIVAQIHRRELPTVLTWMAGSTFAGDTGFKTVIAPTLFPPDQVLSAHLPLPTAFTNPYRNVLGYAAALQSRLPGSRLLLAGVGFEADHLQFYVRGTGYDLYHELQQNRLHTCELQSLTLTMHQRDANLSARMRLDELKRRGETTPQRFQTGPYSISEQIIPGATIHGVLKDAHLNSILKDGYGDEWYRIGRRHMYFCD